MQIVYQRVEAEIGRDVAKAVARHGVPDTIGAAHDMADSLYPMVMSRRREMWVREATLIRQANPGVMVPDVSDYKAQALRKLFTNSTGLSPHPRLARVEYFDPATQEMQRVSIPPYQRPDDEHIQKEVTRRLKAGVSRHVKQASRDLVQRTADANNLRWARQLTGRENCAFCAMLASRGAVYTKETVLSSGDGRRYHDHCDCTAVLVRDVKDWDGKDEADELYSLWISTNSMKAFGEKFRELGEFSGVSA